MSPLFTVFICEPCQAGWCDDCQPARDSRDIETDCDCSHEAVA